VRVVWLSISVRYREDYRSVGRLSGSTNREREPYSETCTRTDQQRITSTTHSTHTQERMMVEPILSLDEIDLPLHAYVWNAFEAELKSTFGEPDPVASATLKRTITISLSTMSNSMSTPRLPALTTTLSTPSTTRASRHVLRTASYSPVALPTSTAYASGLKNSTYATGNEETKIDPAPPLTEVAPPSCLARNRPAVMLPPPLPNPTDPTPFSPNLPLELQRPPPRRLPHRPSPRRPTFPVSWVRTASFSQK